MKYLKTENILVIKVKFDTRKGSFKTLGLMYIENDSQGCLFDYQWKTG